MFVAPVLARGYLTVNVMYIPKVGRDVTAFSGTDSCISKRFHSGTRCLQFRGLQHTIVMQKPKCNKSVASDVKTCALTVGAVFSCLFVYNCSFYMS